MIDGIVKLDDIALAFDRVGHVNRLGFDAEQRFGERGFSVAGLSINQKRLAGVHRRTDLRQNVGFDHQMLEGAAAGDPG